MERKAFRPKKRLGQNFLYDPAIAKKIVGFVDLSPQQLVVELGAGRGILTHALVEAGAHVLALEVDATLCAELERQFAPSQPPNGDSGARIEILNADFTKISLTGLLTSRGLGRCVLMGNIPYHLTREVLFSFLTDEVDMLRSAYLMVQREVGERIVSPPGSRVYGITSVILQSLYSTRSLCRVARGSFTPRPKVDSVVLEFRPLEEPVVGAAEWADFARLVKSLFQQRRKTIHKTLRSFYAVSEADLGRLQRTTGIDLSKRPEELSNHDFLKISRSITQNEAVG